MVTDMATVTGMMTAAGNAVPTQAWMLASTYADISASQGPTVTPKVFADLFATALTYRAHKFPTLRNLSRKEA